MLSRKARKGKNVKGFTLIELIIVIAILGILALIAIPRLGGFSNSAKKAADDATAEVIEKSLEMAIASDELIPGGGGIITANKDGVIDITNTNPSNPIRIRNNPNAAGNADIEDAIADLVGLEDGNWFQESGATRTFTISPDGTVEYTGGTSGGGTTEHALTVTASPAASGTVTGAGSYASGESVSITATPATGYRFVRWTSTAGSIANAATASTTFRMPGTAATVTASFELITGGTTYVLTVNSTTGGTATGTGNYTAGTSVTIVATPNSGYQFVNWTNSSGAVISTSATYNYTMPAQASTVTANFAAVTGTQYALTVLATTGGTATGTGTYTAGTSVTIAATANTGYQFVNWTSSSGTVLSTSATYNYTMPGNAATVTANFVSVTGTQYALTVNATAGGTATGSGRYTAGTSVTIVATANSGNKFVNWTDSSGTILSTSATYNYTMPGQASTVTANFADLNDYIVTTSVLPAGIGSVSGGGTYTAGANVTVTAPVIAGYTFKNWTLSGITVSTITNPAVFNMPARNVSLTANYEVTKYTLTIAAGAGGSVTSSGGSFAPDASVPITATPANGYTFKEWTTSAGGTFTNANSASTSFKMPANNVTVTASFTLNLKDTGWVRASSSSNNDGVSNVGNAYDNNTNTSADFNRSDSVEYAFGQQFISINKKNIQGIEVKLVAKKNNNKNRNLQVALIDNDEPVGGSVKNVTLTTDTQTFTLGNPTDTWNGKWDDDGDFSWNNHFRVKITATGSTSKDDIAYLYDIQVKIYYLD